MSIKVLLIEDNPDHALIAEKSLKKASGNFDIECSQDAQAGLQNILNRHYDVVLCDYRLPGVSALDILKKARAEGKEVPFIIVTAAGNEKIAVESMKEGAYDYIVKDSAFAQSLPLVIERAFENFKHKKAALLAQEALKESEERFRAIFEQAAVGVALIDTQTGRFLRVNQRFSDIVGYSMPEIIDKTFMMITYPDDLDEDLKNMERLKQGEIKNFTMEKRYRRKDGSLVWVDLTVSPMWQEREVPDYHIAVVADITERKTFEQKLENAAKEWRITFDSISDLVSIHDKNFTLLRVNKAFANAFGMHPKEVIGRKCYELMHGSEGCISQCPHNKALKTKKPATQEIFEPKIGMYLEITCSPIFNDAGEVISTVHIVKNIGPRKEIEKKQRLAQLGKLVADMAHEVNNPLMVISGRAQLSLMETIESGEVKKNIDIIIKECQRAKEIIQRLLRFSRPSKGEIKDVDIHKSIEEVVALIEHQFSLANIHIQKDYHQDTLFVLIDEKQLQEVFMNLLNNARDSMAGGGYIRVRTAKEDDYVRIDIHDTGGGMDQETLSKVFDPFFTTKEHGTGLGLSVCFGIIKAHKGDLKVRSVVGEGTTASIFLPAHKGGS